MVRVRRGARHPGLTLHVRAGAIQALEFTYELSLRMLRRFLRATEDSPGAVDEMSFNDLVRRGGARGPLRAELADWKGFRRDRGTTSHAHDEARAQAVFATIPAFLAEAKYLLARLVEEGDRAR